MIRLILACIGLAMLASVTVPNPARLALNMDQVIQYAPPPNPGKELDPRFVGYRDEYGESSWELDALEPTVLAALVREEVEDLIDRDAWSASVARENEERARLSAIAEHWIEVESFIRNRGYTGGAA